MVENIQFHKLKGPVSKLLKSSKKMKKGWRGKERPGERNIDNNQLFQCEGSWNEARSRKKD